MIPANTEIKCPSCDLFLGLIKEDVLESDLLEKFPGQIDTRESYVGQYLFSVYSPAAAKCPCGNWLGLDIIHHYMDLDL